MISPTLNVPQARFLSMPHKFKAYIAGFGSGKTWVGCGGICKGIWEHPGINQGYFAPTYPQIRDIFYPTVEEVAADWGLNVKINEGNKEVHFYYGRQYRGTTICRSMEKPQTIVGFKIGNALVDELDILPKEKARTAWRKIIARMRYKIDGLRNGIDVTTTPEGFKFVYEQFVKAVREKTELASLYGLVQASTFDNEKNLPADYIPSLLESYPPELIKAYLRGQFTNLTSGTVYHQFDRKLNNCEEVEQPGELNELAIYEAGYQLSLFDSMLPDFVADVHPLVGISPDALYAAAMARPFQGRLLSEWASDLEADRLRRITNTVRQGFLLGDTNEQIARKIRGHVSKGFQDGALQMSRANAASIAKTAVGHLAATARESFASANNDLIKGKQWLSTLDNRTTPQCRIRDRLKYTLNNKPVGHSVPYLQGPGKIHFCCRSTETFILKSAKELGIDVRDISPAERASMDGVVAGDTTYREWFLRQPYTRQKQIVGETRAKLIRDGGRSAESGRRNGGPA